MGTTSAAVLALVGVRWRDIQRVWSGPKNHLYLGATLVCLAISLAAAPFAGVTKNPSALIGAIQAIGVVWGTMIVLSSFLPDMWKSLIVDLDEGRALVLTGLLAVAGLLCLLALAVYLVVATLPWWMLLVILGAAIVRTAVQLRYGSIIRRLVASLPTPQR
jgi:hypothetical protein